MLLKSIVILCVLFQCNILFAWQAVPEFSNAEIKTLISNFKKDERGPFQAIRWFCTDGTVVLPKERCPQPGGIQHALHKEIVNKLGSEKGIYLGQILAGTKFEDFWDAENNHSRLKQYLLQQYLFSIDDGWILRKARFYRGALQAEDEADWGYRFLNWLVTDYNNLNNNFFIIRQAFRMIPHNADDILWDQIRAVSKVLSDSIPEFTDLRVKLHGQPEKEDLHKVITFRKKNNEKIKTSLQIYFDQLEIDLAVAFQPLEISILENYLQKLPENSRIRKDLTEFINKRKNNNDWDLIALKEAAALLLECRLRISDLQESQQRVSAIDLSIALESLMFKNINGLDPVNPGELFEKSNILAITSFACGFIEKWEFDKIKDLLMQYRQSTQISIVDLQQKVETFQRLVDWSSGMVDAAYKEVVSMFSNFEPLAAGFIDDRIRGSVLLPMGRIAGKMLDFYMQKVGIQNDVLDIISQNQIRGLNPGFARGELIVIKDMNTDIDFSADKIYVLAQPPADLKPVAGLLTKSDGNLVSHVQLLARNLGIPNSIITMENFNELINYNGNDVFYAVSPRGKVILRIAEKMSETEKELLKKSAVQEDKFLVPTKKLDLQFQHIINLRRLRNKDSGVLTGPKAANLGELKYLFPNHVVEGFAIPFGIYRKHMDQPMPNQSVSYWQFLHKSFNKAEEMRKQKVNKVDIEKYVLLQLTVLRDAIKQMPFLPEFKDELEKSFIEILSKHLGQIPVFIRSDTNMEDLKDFTGAGLNLTVFNVLKAEAIWQGIRDVWASPFSERSYRWRQRLLLNPEDVYPSILIIPSVNVEKSGVMITSNVLSGTEAEITIAFNRGAGGAVEGQSAESYVIKSGGNSILLSPCREYRYTSLPEEGGIRKPVVSFSQNILTSKELEKLYDFAINIGFKLVGKKGFEKSGPLDVELGFKDENIWLFQVRPFVESKRAKSSTYLNGLDTKLILNKKVDLTKFEN